MKRGRQPGGGGQGQFHPTSHISHPPRHLEGIRDLPRVLEEICLLLMDSHPCGHFELTDFILVIQLSGLQWFSVFFFGEAMLQVSPGHIKGRMCVFSPHFPCPCRGMGDF